MNRYESVFVSVIGDDNNSGTENSPFKTLGRAQREVRNKDQDVPVTVYLREGSYYLEAPLVFTPNDSGTEKAPHVWCAYPGEKPLVSGGIRLRTEWEYFAEGVYRASLKGQRAESGFDQLFGNGRRKILARYPNGNPLNPLLENYTFLEGADEREFVDADHFSGLPPRPHKEVYYSKNMFTSKIWKKPQEAIMHVFPEVNWNALQFQLRGIDYDRQAILLGQGGHQQHERWAARPGTTLGRTSRFYIENVFEELDSPGEWYYDEDEAYLYYLPEEREDIDQMLFEVPLFKDILRFEGAGDQCVRHIALKGLRFSHTTRTFMDPYCIPSMGDWGIVPRGALYFHSTESCLVEDCFIDAPGGNGVFAHMYNKNLVLRDNLITECGESGIALVGKPMLTRDKSYDCPYCGHHHPWGFDKHTEEYSRECVISNNKIHDIGVYGKQTAGLFMAVAACNRVSGNEMYNIPRAAVCVHDGTFGGHIFENNYLHHTCRDTDEHGTFNSWGRDSWWCHAQSHRGVSHPAGDVTKDTPFTNIIRHNLFLDFKGWGIDLDDGSSHYDIYSNVCVGVGIKNREGDLRRVHNNIVYLPTVEKPAAIQVGCENNQDEWYNNIIFTKEDCIHFTLPPKNGPYLKGLDHNCYYSLKGYFASHGMDFEEWKNRGYDRHSLFGNPLFKDPENLDFTVSEDSPALAVGFTNFPMDRFGLKNFPDTWKDIEPNYPLYDYDTMNRDTLKSVRNSISPVESVQGEYLLTPEKAQCLGCRQNRNNHCLEFNGGPKSEAKWHLKYHRGGKYQVSLEYSCRGCDKVRLEVTAFVESIGENSLPFLVTHGSDQFIEETVGILSLSGEETDNITITLKMAELTAPICIRKISLKRVP